MDAFLRGLEPDAVAALRALVEINSFTLHRDGVNRVGALAEELFAPLGFRAERVRSVTPECGDHLFLKRAGAGRGLLLVAHLDTVYPPETDFAWREEGARIFGPGTADIKGGIVLVWMALCALRDEEPALFDGADWTIALNASEEGGCADFPRLVRARVHERTAAALVFETGVVDEAGAATAVVARKGAARFRVDVFGREAHSGNAHAAGASAVRELARLVERIEALTDPPRDVTFNVGVVSGGTTVNTVAGHARARVDLRARTTADAEAGRAAMLALAGPGSVESRDGNHRCRIEVIEEPGYPPWEPNAESDRLAAVVSECADALGQRVVAAHRHGASDGSHLCDLVPTVDGLGPIGRDIHCSLSDPARGRFPESVDRASFVPRARLSAALFRRLLQP